MAFINIWALYSTITLMSNKFQMSPADWHKLGEDALFFFSIPAVWYLNTLISRIGLSGHVLHFNDFLPTGTDLTVFVTYLAGQLLNFFRKYIRG